MNCSMVFESAGISRRWSPTQIDRCQVVHHRSVGSLFNQPSPKEKKRERLNATSIENPLTELQIGPKTSENSAILRHSPYENLPFIMNPTSPNINASSINNSFAFSLFYHFYQPDLFNCSSCNIFKSHWIFIVLQQYISPDTIKFRISFIWANCKWHYSFFHSSLTTNIGQYVTVICHRKYVKQTFQTVYYLSHRFIVTRLL